MEEFSFDKNFKINEYFIVQCDMAPDGVAVQIFSVDSIDMTNQILDFTHIAGYLSHDECIQSKFVGKSISTDIVFKK